MPQDSPVDREALIQQQIIAVTEELNEKLVFTKSPFGTEAERAQILALLKESKIRSTPRFEEYIRGIYSNIQTNNASKKVVACLQTIANYIIQTQQTVPPNETLATLKKEIAKFQNGISRNAAELTALLPQIEDIAFILTQQTNIPLEEKIQILYNLYDPIAQCAPGAQGQINAIHIYLTANNLLQRLGNYVKAVLYELNRGRANQQYDAGPHALNKDLIYVFRQGMNFLDVDALVKLNDPYGAGHNAQEIANILARDFTVEKFVENCLNEALSTLAGNIQLTFSLRDMGLDLTSKDAKAVHNRSVFNAAFLAMGIDITKPNHIDQLFTSGFVSAHGLYKLCKDLDELSSEFEDLIFDTPANNPNGTCWIDVQEQQINIWYKTAESTEPEIILSVPVGHVLFNKIANLKNKKTTDLIQTINPKDKQGTIHLEFNKDFIKYMVLNKLLEYKMLGKTKDANYKILAQSPQMLTKQAIDVGDNIKIWLISYGNDVEVFVMRRDSLVDVEHLSKKEKIAYKHLMLGIYHSLDKNSPLANKLTVKLLNNGLLAHDLESDQQERAFHQQLVTNILQQKMQSNESFDLSLISNIRKTFVDQQDFYDAVSQLTIIHWNASDKSIAALDALLRRLASFGDPILKALAQHQMLQAYEMLPLMKDLFAGKFVPSPQLISFIILILPKKEVLEEFKSFFVTALRSNTINPNNFNILCSIINKACDAREQSVVYAEIFTRVFTQNIILFRELIHPGESSVRELADQYLKDEPGYQDFCIEFDIDMLLSKFSSCILSNGVNVNEMLDGIKSSDVFQQHSELFFEALKNANLDVKLLSTLNSNKQNLNRNVYLKALQFLAQDPHYRPDASHMKQNKNIQAILHQNLNSRLVAAVIQGGETANELLESETFPDVELNAAITLMKFNGAFSTLRTNEPCAKIKSLLENSKKNHDVYMQIKTWLLQMEQSPLFRHNPLVFFRILQSQGVDALLQHVARSSSNTNSNLLETKIEYFLSKDPEYAPSFFKRSLSMFWQQSSLLKSQPELSIIFKGVIEPLAIIVCCALAADVFYTTFTMNNPSIYDLLRNPDVIIRGMVSYRALQPITAAVAPFVAPVAGVLAAAVGIIGSYLLFSNIYPSYREHKIADILSKFKNSKLIDAALNKDSVGMKAFLRTNNFAKDEVQAAIQIVQYTGRPIEISAVLTEYMARPRIETQPSAANAASDLVIDNIKCNDAALRARILANFVAREEALQALIVTSRTIRTTDPEFAEVNALIATETAALKSDKAKFLTASEDQMPETVQVYLQERKPQCAALQKSTLLILRDYKTAEVKEGQALDALEQTAPNAAPRRPPAPKHQA
jgi:hypothetical protein